MDEKMSLLPENWIIIPSSLIFIIFSLLYYYITRNYNYWKKRGVIQIKPTFPFGNFKDVILQRIPPGPCLQKWYKDYEKLPYVGFYVFDRPFLMLRDPEIIKNILIKDSYNFLDKHFTGDANCTLSRANLFLIKNPGWKYLRPKLTPVYTSGKLKKMYHLMVEVCEDFDNFLEGQNLQDGGKIYEMKELCGNLMTDMIATTAYGIRANSVNNPNAEFRVNGRRIFAWNFYRGFEFLAMFFAPQFVKPLHMQFFQKQSTEFLRKVFWSALVDREKSGIRRNDLIDLLIELKNSQPEEEKKIMELNGDNLVAQAAVFFTGGFETSSSVMSFCLHELATRPEIQNNLREEILRVIDENDGKLTYDVVTTCMPYLDMVVCEALRMYPTLPFLDREAMADYKIPGTDLIIEKGIPVIVPMMGLHMDEEYFPNPMEFNPERFSEENMRKRRRGVYMPFGEGPHACIGQRLGSLQVKLGLITIIKKYEVLICEKTQIPLKIHPKAIFTTADPGIFVKLRKIGLKN